MSGCASEWVKPVALSREMFSDFMQEKRPHRRDGSSDCVEVADRDYVRVLGCRLWNYTE